MAVRVPHVMRVETMTLLDHCVRLSGCRQCIDLTESLAELTSRAGVEGRLDAEYVIAAGHLDRVHCCEPSTAYLAA